ncbi:MAG: hypothetical protein H7328_09335 [Bdellovibrio sp.]|nr:hypothetical protein [Bdellovibrio sp.]
MTTNENVPNSKNSKIVFLLLFAALIVAVLSSLSSVQKIVQPMFRNSSRVVLAKVSAIYGEGALQFLILKVKDANGLQIEVYQVNPLVSSQEFKQKFDLALDSDAYVTIDKNSTNLALSDVDHDGHMDILAPSVDRNGNLRLNTFRYNADLKMFEPHTETTN